MKPEKEAMEQQRNTGTRHLLYLIKERKKDYCDIQKKQVERSIPAGFLMAFGTAEKKK